MFLLVPDPRHVPNRRLSIVLTVDGSIIYKLKINEPNHVAAIPSDTQSIPIVILYTSAGKGKQRRQHGKCNMTPKYRVSRMNYLQFFSRKTEPRDRTKLKYLSTSRITWRVFLEIFTSRAPFPLNENGISPGARICQNLSGWVRWGDSATRHDDITSIF